MNGPKKKMERRLGDMKRKKKKYERKWTEGKVKRRRKLKEMKLVGKDNKDF